MQCCVGRQSVAAKGGVAPTLWGGAEIETPVTNDGSAPLSLTPSVRQSLLSRDCAKLAFQNAAEPFGKQTITGIRLLCRPA